jgi:riboflavin kinase/FMN adenylyltransferase
VLEVHLFDFGGDLYGMDVEVEFLRFVRGEKKFASVEELRDQIVRDIAAVR